MGKLEKQTMNKLIIIGMLVLLGGLGFSTYYLLNKIESAELTTEKNRLTAQEDLKKVVDTVVQVLDHEAAGRLLFKDSSYVMCHTLGLDDVAFPCWITKDSSLQSGNLAVFDVYVVNTTGIDLSISAKAWGLTKATEGDMKLFRSDAENVSEPVIIKAGTRGTIEIRLPSREIKELTGVGLRLQVNNIMYRQQ